MNDSDRAIVNDLHLDAFDAMAAWPSVECQVCGCRIVGDDGDLDAHLTMEHGIEAADVNTETPGHP